MGAGLFFKAKARATKAAVLFLPIALLAILGASPVKKAKPQSKISVTTRLDKTAVWVGDTLRYSVRVLHDPDIDFVQDNLTKEAVSLPPFVVREVVVRKGDWAQNKRWLEVDLLLGIYETGKSEIIVPPFNLYYFRREPAMVKRELSAESVQVPASKIALRSTLGAGAPKLRDYRPMDSPDLSRAIVALVVGVSAAGLVVGRSGMALWRFLRRERPIRNRRSRRARGGWLKRELAKIRQLKENPPADSKVFHSEIAQLVRRFLSERLDVETSSLTPAEIGSVLHRQGQSDGFSEQVKAILEQCDAACYSRDGLPVNEPARRQMLESLERILADRS
jgi:hypothetical protein